MREINGFYLPDNERHMERTIEKDPSGYQTQARLALMFAAARYDLVIDVGAHIGTWAKDLSGAFRTVVAFEPVPSNIECLRRNVPSARIEAVALGAKPGRVNLSPVDDNTGACYVWPDGEISAECRTLDSYNLAPDAIKIDVEGQELSVLQGAVETLTTYWPALCIECKGGPERYGIGQFESVKFAESLGYDMILQINGDFILKKRRQTQ